MKISEIGFYCVFPFLLYLAFHKLKFQCLLPFLLLPELDQAEQDPDIILLSHQFKATAMELISVLEQVSHELVFTFF